MNQTSLKCSCGAVTVTVADGVECVFSAICHCNNCRSTTGAPAFWGNGFPIDTVTVTGETINYTQEVNTRISCVKCGSFIAEPCPGFGITMLPAARLANPTAPMMHVFVKDKVYPIPEDGVPQFDEMPPQ